MTSIKNIHEQSKSNCNEETINNNQILCSICNSTPSYIVKGKKG